MKRTFIALAALAFAAATAGPAFSQQGSGGEQAAGDPVVARVNGSEIRQSDLAVAFSRLPAQIQQLPLETLFPQLVQQLVDVELMSAAGRASDLHNSQDVLDRVAAFEKVAVQQAYVEGLIGEQVTEDKLRANYDATIAQTEGPIEVRASHILVESEEEGADIIKALEGGADFAELARERSTGPSGPRGGDLGYFVRSAMVQPFADAAFSLEPGTVGPDPVQTQFGWHVIKVVDKRRRPAPTFEESRAQLEEQLTREVITTHISDLRADAKIELFNLDGSPVESAPRQ
jgi:peptidyl-prolyl cis-trans isomerase C